MDLKVLQVQEWLNQQYPVYFNATTGTFPVGLDGKTGQTTVKALVMALQIEVGATPVDGVMGSGTISKCPTISSGSSRNLLKIAQGGLLCKGYNAGDLDGLYGNTTRNAMNQFISDAGFESTPGSLSPMFMNALLNTDPFVIVTGSNAQIRKVQQFLNANYSNLYWTKQGLIPTSGIYERKTNKAIIYALQNEIGTTADGAIGNNTYSLMPNLSVSSSPSNCIKLLRFALVCNGFAVDNLSTIYDTNLAEVIKQFQLFSYLQIDPTVELGKVNRRTWGALLISKGDVDRPPNACDCATKLNEAKANALYAAGFQYVGRYLTKVQGGLDKNLTTEELGYILQAGLKLFPIFQENNTQAAHFTYEKGHLDAEKAYNAARDLKLPPHTVIYFAVDCDLLDNQIETYAIPYFRSIHDYFRNIGTSYKIGIYGSRNICSQISELGFAQYSFISDMSSGFSGNLGYKMPQNWSFDQFYEKSNYPIAGSTMALDYVTANGKDKGVSNLIESVNYTPPYFPSADDMASAKKITELLDKIKLLEIFYWNYSENFDITFAQRARKCVLSVLDYLYHYKYTSLEWDVITPKDLIYIFCVEQNIYLDDILSGYITYVTEETTDNTYETKPTLISDGDYGLMELAHLALVIKCYLDSLVPGAWSAWAGDLASAINETWVNSGQSEDLHENLEIAYRNMGAAEPKRSGIHDARQFNYYDIISDLDGYKIAQLISEECDKVANGLSTEKFILSSVLSKYYGEDALYRDRFKYGLAEQGWANSVPSVMALTYDLVNYINFPDQALLVGLKIGTAYENNQAVFSTCMAYANYLVYMNNNK